MRNRFWPLVGQTVATGDICGRTVLASVKALQTASDPLSITRRVILKLIFTDASGRHLGQAERQFLRAGSAVDQFVEGRIAAEAPPGTMAVKWEVLLNASRLPTGSIAVIGLNGRGKSHLAGFGAIPGLEIATVVDPDQKVLDRTLAELAKKAGDAPLTTKGEKDFRRVLDDKSIDAITVATPNHWHSLMTIMGA